MAKLNPHAKNANFCVSVTTYFSSELEAESAFLLLKDVSVDKTIELFERLDEEKDWEELDRFDCPEKEEPQ